ncbi:hypothetical protein [Paludisphaera soli]|uniref:hypothetical protein n=1 Tax=Paludisphaera soli TaxID=2712865 RepID=UPI0013EAE541|nr:hypothetical protein [Paludisphaera soli]
MSWHTSAVLIGVDRSDGMAEFLEELGFPEARRVRSVSFQEASGFGDADGPLTVAVATVDGWTSIWGPLLVADGEALLRASRQAPVFTLIMEGGSGTYSFEWYRDGSRVRLWLAQRGEVLREEGEPLAEERETLGDDGDGEQRILKLMDSLTVPFERLASAEYDLYELPCD